MGVTDALAQTLIMRFDGPRLTAARRLMLGSQPDLLGILGKCANENAHSDVLRWLLDPCCAPTLAPHALMALFDRLPSSPHETASAPDDRSRWLGILDAALHDGCVSVRREHVIGDDDLDRIDLLLSGPGFLVAIENKVRSSEHDDQTVTYATWLQANARSYGGFFLTPAGGWAASRHFTPLSYLELVEVLLAAYEARLDVTADEETVLGGYLKSLAVSILRTELRALQGGRHGAE